MDDVPTARDDERNAENADDPVKVNVIGNDTAGADGVDLATGVSLVADSIVGNGTVTYDGAGSFTYTPGTNDEGQVSFEYRIVDGDGDVSIAEVRINLGEDSEPVIVSKDNATVDEDGLPGANVDGDPLQSDPREVDGSESRVSEGQIVVDYSADVPTDLTDAFRFINADDLDGQLTSDGNEIDFTVDGNGDLVGTADGNEVIRIEITGASVDAAGVATYDYRVTLSGPVDHPDVDNEENDLVDANGDLRLQIQFDVTDSDGTDTTEGSFFVNVLDDVPTAGDATVAQPEEDGPVSIDLATVITAGADGVSFDTVTYEVVSGDPANLSYENGVFTYTPTAGEEADVVFTYTVTDGDGDEATGTITFDLQDDGSPEIGTIPTVQVDEDGLPGANIDGAPQDPSETTGSGSASGGSSFQVDFGNDVPDTPDGAVRFVEANVGDYDGVFTQDGQDIEFALNADGELVGRVNGVGDPVITLSIAYVSISNGVATYQLNVLLEGPIDQPLDDREDVSTTLNVSIEAVDSDGSVSVPQTVGVQVLDDVQTLTVTESDGTGAGQVATTTDVGTPGASNSDQIAIDALVDYTIVDSIDGRAGETADYALVLLSGAASSGLTSQGAAVNLFVGGDGVVYASTANDLAGAMADPVFTVAISGGDVVLTQFAPIDHAAGSDLLTLADDLIGLSYDITVVDGDGDVADESGTIDLGGNLAFADDAPLGIDDDNSVGENAAEVEGNVLTNDVGGADGGLSVVGAVAGDSDGGSVTVPATPPTGELEVDGQYGTLFIRPDGSYRYVPDDGLDLNEGQTLDDVFTYTLVDRDGDADEAVLSITITNENAPPTGDAQTAIVSEEGLSAFDPNPDGSPGNDDTNSATASGTFAFADGDGNALTYGFGTPPSGYSAADGTALVWQPVSESNGVLTLTATAGMNGDPYLTITLDADTGAFSVTLEGPLQHPDGTIEDEFDIVVPVTVDDGTATVNTTLTIEVEDDSPELSFAATPNDDNSLKVVSSDATLGDVDVSSGSFLGEFGTLTKSYGADGQGPADVASYSLSVTNSDSGLTSGGNPITLEVNGDGDVVGSANGTPVFTVSVDDNGVVSVTQTGPIDHANGSDSIALPDGKIALDVDVTIEDADGDEASASDTLDLGGNIVFTDDAPTVTPGNADGALVLDETNLIGSSISVSTNYADNFGPTPFDYGNDGPATAGAVSYSLDLTASGTDPVASGLFALNPNSTGMGEPIYLVEEGGVVYGTTDPDARTAGNTYFQIAVNATTGELTFTQTKNVWHPNTGSDNEAVSFSLSGGSLEIVQTLTDFDGDSSSAGIDIGSAFTILDDGPDLSGSPDYTTSNNPSTADFTGSIGIDVSTDEGQTFQINVDLNGLTSNGSTLTRQEGTADNVFIAERGDGTDVFTITVNANGTYTFDMQQPLDGNVVDVPIGGNTAFGSGPNSAQILTPASQPSNDIAVVVGFNTSNFDRTVFKAGGSISSSLTPGEVNGSTNGWGVDNQNFNTNQFMLWDFGSGPLTNIDGAGGYTPPSGATLPDASYAVFEFIGMQGTTIDYVINFTDGTFTSGTFSPTSRNFTFRAQGTEDQLIADVQLFGVNAGGGGKVDLVSVGIYEETVDVEIPVTIEVTDGDGDSETDSFIINVEGSATSPTTNGGTAEAPAGHQVAANDDFLIAEMETANMLGMVSAMAIGVGLAASHQASFDMMPGGTAEGIVMGDFAAMKGLDFVALAPDAPLAAEASLLVGSAGGGSDPIASTQMTDKVAVDTDLAAETAPMAEPTAPMADAAPEAVMAAPDFGADIMMPGADALAMMAAAQKGSVDLKAIGADALVGDGSGDAVEAVLESVGGTDAIEAIAMIQPANDAVPIWDSGAMGGFTAEFSANMGAEAMMLAPDAGSPMING
ncbi:DUF5801 repeats-in-toxin domain-containing protein [Sphingomicrobium maritimum]|uniref:DUF5801 repeats-in-toxin domain-containing protein n=1 Tax=Sphingomicrobium maritimum TaxID=3133972 RepID=UPI003D769073